MKVTLIVALFCLVAITSATKAPKFCNGLDCPEYSVLETTKDYELRVYKESQWVTTNMKGVSYEQATRPMFMRLFKYISGNNVRKEKIAMTAPVTNRIIPGQGPACESNFNMSFFVPPNSNPPKPSDPNVTLVTLPPRKVYIRSFSGFAFKYEKNRDQALALAAAIKNESKFDATQWFTAGYDSPFKLFNRHNEVWFLAK